MLNKIMIALTAAVAIGSASVAFAEEVPENKIGDRYPFLEQKEMKAPARMASARTRNSAPLISIDQFTDRNQYANEPPENKIGDRYPFLEQPAKSINRVAGHRHAKHAKHA